MEPIEPTVVTLTVAARETGLSKESVRRAIANGYLPARQLGTRGKYFITPAALAAWIEQGAPTGSAIQQETEQ